VADGHVTALAAQSDNVPDDDQSESSGGVMDCIFRSRPTAHGVRLFAIVVDSAGPSQRPTTASDDLACSVGKACANTPRPLTPRPPAPLTATYTRCHSVTPKTLQCKTRWRAKK
jgi:hypothetical protein